MTSKFSVEVADKLLEKLSTDDDFRDLFEKNPRAALKQLGHDTPPGDRGAKDRDPVAALEHLRGGLASKETIAAGRETMMQMYRASDQTGATAAGLPFGQFDFCAD